uniref:Uncharacterized protein n=1 Tax=Globisporangium ultimum (strain ATCC 200006 / CBS 805.95 / DAOM BR144) TaxID=431595 RepID=K3WTM1_GLOUD
MLQLHCPALLASAPLPLDFLFPQPLLNGDQFLRCKLALCLSNCIGRPLKFLFHSNQFVFARFQFCSLLFDSQTKLLTSSDQLLIGIGLLHELMLSFFQSLVQRALFSVKDLFSFNGKGVLRLNLLLQLFESNVQHFHL